MRKNHSIHEILVVAFIGLSLSATFPALLGGQVKDSPSNPHNLSAQVKLFNNYSKDFEAMEQPLQHGEELQVVEFLDQAAKTAEDRLYALDAELQMYDNISCKPDRAKVRRIPKEQLGYYSWVFDSEVTRTTGGLTFSKVPAAAQTGLRMKDDLRAAKGVLW